MGKVRAPEQEQQNADELAQQQAEQARLAEEARQREEEQRIREAEEARRRQAEPPPTTPPNDGGPPSADTVLGSAWWMFGPRPRTPGLFDPFDLTSSVAATTRTTPQESNYQDTQAPTSPEAAPTDPQTAPTTQTTPAPDIPALAPERKAVLDQKARDLKGQINAITLRDGSGRELAEVVRGIRDPKEAAYLLDTYNEMYTAAGEKPLTMDDLIRQAGTQFDKAWKAGTGDEELQGVFERRLRGDPEAAAEEAFRVATNGQGQGIDANTVDPGTLEVSQQDARRMVDAFRDLTPAQRESLLAKHPHYEAWLNRGLRQLGDEDRRHVAVMLDAKNQRAAAWQQVRQEAIEEKRRLALARRREAGSTEPLSPEEEATIRQEVDQTDASAYAERAETLAQKRSETAIAASDLLAGTSEDKANGILDEAAKDPDYRKLLLEQYTAGRGEIPLGPDGKPMDALSVLERDLAAKASEKTVTEGLSDIWNDPSSILWRPVLGADPNARSQQDDVAQVKSRIALLRSQEKTETTRERIAQLTKDPNVSADTLAGLADTYESDPRVKAAMDLVGVTREDLVSARDAQEEADAQRKAADFLKAVRNDDAGAVVEALDDPASRQRREDIARRRSEAEKSGDQEAMRKLDEEASTLDQTTARRRELFQRALQQDTKLSPEAFVDAEIKNARMKTLVGDAIQNGHVAREDMVYVAGKTGNPALMSKALNGASEKEVQALNQRVRQRYGDADFSRRYIKLTEDTTDETDGQARYDNHGNKIQDGGVTVKSQTSDTGALDTIIDNMTVESELQRSALKVMTKGDPTTIYDPANPPTDPAEARAAAQRRLQVEAERDEIAYDLQRDPTTFQWLEDGFENLAKFKGTGKAADEKYDELKAWRRANAERLATDPKAWAEYERLRNIVRGNLEENAAYNRAAVDATLSTITVVGGLAITAATAGTSAPVTLAALTALGLSKVAIAQMMTDGGLGERELTKRLGSVLMEALVDATLGPGLEALKGSGNGMIKSVATAIDEYGGLDLLKTNASRLLLEDAWKSEPTLMALAKSLGADGEFLVRKMLNKAAVKRSGVETERGKKVVTSTVGTTIDTVKGNVPTLGDMVSKVGDIALTEEPSTEPEITSPIPR